MAGEDDGGWQLIEEKLTSILNIFSFEDKYSGR